MTQIAETFSEINRSICIPRSPEKEDIKEEPQIIIVKNVTLDNRNNGGMEHLESIKENLDTLS
jgi:hypothetical protein